MPQSAIIIVAMLISPGSVFVDFDSFITVSENSAPRVCATVNMSTSDCPVGFPFELVLSTSNGTAGYTIESHLIGHSIIPSLLYQLTPLSVSL